MSLCVVIVLLLAPGLTRLELATDGLALVPEDAVATELDQAAREHFGIHDQVIVVLRSSESRGIFNPDTLATLSQLTERISSLPSVGPGRVQSLANEQSDRVRQGTLDFVPWLTPLPTSTSDLVRLQKDLQDAGVYNGTLLSNDSPSSMTACLVDVPRELSRASFVAELQSLLDQFDPGSDELLLVGAPIAEATLGQHILEDLARLVPLSLLCMLLIFFAAFRRPVAALLPLLEVGACLTAVLGLMGWVGAPIYLTVAILPVVLTAVGVADELHLFVRFLGLRNGTRVERVERTMQELTRPIVHTSLTTAIGFLSFTLSPLAPVRTFGLFMAVGVLFCMLWSLVAVPALLVLLPERYFGPPRVPLRTAGLARFLTRHRKLAAWVVIPLVLGACLGITRLVVQDSWLAGFAPDSEIALATRTVDEFFGGAHLLRVRIDADGPVHAGQLRRDHVQSDSIRIPGVIAQDVSRLIGQRFVVDLQLGAETTHQHEGRIENARFEHGETLITLAPERLSLERRLSTRHEEFPYQIDSQARMLQPDAIEQLRRLEAFLATQGELGVGRVLGPHEHLAAMNFMLRLRDPEHYQVPKDRQALGAVLDRYVDVRGENRLREILGTNSSSALVTVFLRHSNYRDTQSLMDRVQEFARTELAPFGLKLSFAGDVAVSQSMIGAIVNTQIFSLGLSLLGIWLVASLLLRSLTLGLACAIPALAAVGSVLGFMGWAGVPLGVATSMFAATVLGIGVDYAIHLLHRARESEGPEGVDWHATIEEAARPLLLDAFAIGIAFGLLAASQVPANAQLGVCVAVSLLVCALVTLVVLPVCVTRVRARRRKASAS